MPRWKPDARERLVVAAFELFAEQGYEQTTVGQIAERAGLTRSTFFRHFSDKRTILTVGQETLARLLTEGIEAAAPDAGALTAVAAGLDRACSVMTPFNRELSPLMRAAVEADEELRNREAMKTVGLAATMVDALTRRGVPLATAELAADMGTLAFKNGFARWVDPRHDDDPGELAAHTRAALDELRAAAAELR